MAQKADNSGQTRVTQVLPQDLPVARGRSRSNPVTRVLPRGERADNVSGSPRQIAQGRVWPQRSAPTKRLPTQVAALPYQPKGFVIDFETRGGSTTSMAFETGKTYYITNFFYIGPGRQRLSARMRGQIYQSCRYPHVWPHFLSRHPANARFHLKR